MENAEAIKLKKEINKLEMKIIKFSSKYDKQIREMKNRMDEVCIHNEVETKYEYEPGGYYDRCVYIDKIICKVCGKVINEKRTQGGFN